MRVLRTPVRKRNCHSPLKHSKVGFSVNQTVDNLKPVEGLDKTDKEHLREIRIIKGLAPFVTAFQTFANKVLIW
jgi:hypothetical protein